MAFDIAIKKAGDQLSAIEFNQIVDEIKLKATAAALGSLTALSTANKQSVVLAINEVFDEVGIKANQSSIGDLIALKTIDKNSIVNAVNEVLLNTHGLGAASESITVKPSDFSSNVFSDAVTDDYYLQSALSDLDVITEATSLIIEGGNMVADTDAGIASISVFVDGVYNQVVKYQAGEARKIKQKTIVLPEGRKRVTLRLGATQSVNGQPGGSFINKVMVPSGYGVTLIKPQTKQNRAVILGDSISVGIGTTRPETKAFIPVIRANQGFNTQIASYGWGRGRFTDIVGTAAQREKVIGDLRTFFAGAVKKILWIELSTNDYGAGVPIATFSSAYGAFIDELKAAIPNIKIYAQTAFARINEDTANSAGAILEDYRAATGTVVSANGRNEFTTLINGKTIVDLSTMPDGVHPNDTGNAIIADYIKEELTEYGFFTTDGTLNSMATNPGASFNLGALGNWTITGKIRKKRDSVKEWVFTQGDVLVDAKTYLFGFENDNTFKVLVFNKLQLVTTTAVTDRVWHHFAVKRTSDLYELYVDNVKVAEGITSAIMSPADKIYIGGNDLSDYPASIDIDYIRVYGNSLSAAEIQTDSETKTLNNLTGALAAWEFDGDFTDKTGNNNLTPGSTSTLIEHP
jgi:lysophospholipase L1-like esterase